MSHTGDSVALEERWGGGRGVTQCTVALGETEPWGRRGGLEESHTAR